MTLNNNIGFILHLSILLVNLSLNLFFDQIKKP
jgi:hypothetical protein